MRRGGALAALVAAVLLVLAGPAAAHPYFEPGQAPVDSLAELTLDIAHGCVADEPGDGADPGEDQDEAPTREVALEVPEAVTHVQPEEREGWSVEEERDDDGDRVEVVVWTAEEGVDEPAPRFELAAVHTGEVGEQAFWRVLQSCDGLTHRWVGTPDDPATEPAVPVTLIEADPDAPPPEETADDGDDPRDVEEPAGEEPADVDEPADEEAVPAADEPADEGLPGWALPVALLLAVVVAGAALAWRARRGAAGADEG